VEGDEIQDPGFHRDNVSLSFVKDVTTSDGKVALTIAHDARLSRPGPPPPEERAKKSTQKITWRDGFPALWTLIKHRFVD
jgi:hypothetical protein